MNENNRLKWVTNSKARALIGLLAFSFASLALQYEPISKLVEWNRTAITNGEVWRIVTGHFTHSNFYHLAMNLAAMWLICAIFKPSKRRLTTLIIINSVFVGLLLYTTSYTNYVGLSGILHGLIANLALREALNGNRSSWIIVAVLMVKIFLENTLGTSITTSELIQTKVAYEAHTFGAICGFALACIESIKAFNGWWHGGGDVSKTFLEK
mgnify:CR=1 FL=1